MVIKILGSGCKNCIALADNAKTAVTNLGIDAEIVKVTDFAQIAAYGVMSMPALVIDEKVVSSGRVLKPLEVSGLIEKNIKK